ncbi:acyl-CoA dehydrogenase family protein [Nocardia sp. NPDC056100]|uniref:acyl-CoA dehydrogenase family protein n=1 Tax=Nocardia sp. NPDC056100 TaxID=3345712 RepID=UPI0035DD9683
MTYDIEDLRARTRAFIDDRVIPAEATIEAGGLDALRTVDALKKQAKAEGLWALGHPERLGGGGLPLYDFALINEIIGRSEFGQQAVGSITMQDAIMLDLHGTEQQRRDWLQPMVDGDIYPSVAMTEPEVAGSDPTRILTTARLEDGHWIINGHKWFTTGASGSAFTTVFAVTDPDASSPHRRISAIVVPKGTPGMEIVRVIKTMGSEQGDHCEMRFTDVRVPADHVLGERGAGFRIFQDRVGPGRIFHAMRWLGQAQRALELMIERAKTREAHGSPLSDKGEIRRYLAESAAEIQASRLLTLDAARRYDQDGHAGMEISLVKFYGARMLHNVIDRAIQVHGALGVSEDTPLASMYRHARYARIYDGPDEVHRMVVARGLLSGRTPWDKTVAK